MKDYFLGPQPVGKEKYPFAIRMTKTGELVGVTYYSEIFPGDRATGAGLWLLPKAHKIGANRHAAYLIIKYMLDDLSYLRYEAAVKTSNSPSIIAQ